MNSIKTVVPTTMSIKQEIAIYHQMIILMGVMPTLGKCISGHKMKRWIVINGKFKKNFRMMKFRIMKQRRKIIQDKKKGKTIATQITISLIPVSTGRIVIAIRTETKMNHFWIDYITGSETLAQMKVQKALAIFKIQKIAQRIIIMSDVDGLIYEKLENI